MEKQVKGQLCSKAIIGAILTLVSAIGVLPFGATIDVETGQVCFNIYSVTGAIATVGIPGGAVLSWFGRRVARTPIRGLW